MIGIFGTLVFLLTVVAAAIGYVVMFRFLCWAIFHSGSESQ